MLVSVQMFDSKVEKKKKAFRHFMDRQSPVSILELRSHATPHDAHKNLALSQFKTPDSRALLNPMVSRVLGRLEAQDIKHRAHDAAPQRTR